MYEKGTQTMLGLGAVEQRKHKNQRLQVPLQNTVTHSQSPEMCFALPESCRAGLATTCAGNGASWDGVQALGVSH